MLPFRNGLKQGDAFSPVLFNFSLEYATRRIQVNQDGLKLNGTHQLLVYADVIFVGSMYTIKENTETLIVASKEIGFTEMLIKLSTWSCLEIRMLYKFTG
jgi:hypothetical protein